MRYSKGALQGTEHAHDSTGYLDFAHVYCQKTYKIIFLYKDLVTRKKLGYNSPDIFWNKHLGQDDYVGFECYTFVYPQRDPETQPDIHEMPIDFPVFVSAYKRIEKTTWKFVSKIKAKNFEEFSEFQFKVIYNKIK